MVQRYDFGSDSMYESDRGNYVEYEDYAAIEKKLKALAEAVFLTGYEPVSEATYRLAEDICNGRPTI